MRHHTGKPKRRGVALILVLFAVAFLALFTVALLDGETTDLGILRNHAGGLAALYAAHAGINDAIAAIRNRHDTYGTIFGRLTLPDGTTVSYTAVISNANPIATVTSTGRAEGFTRKVRARLVIAGPPVMLPPYPVRVVSWQEVIGS